MFSVCATTCATCEHYGLTVTGSHTRNDEVNSVKQNVTIKLEQTCVHFYTVRTVYNLVVRWIKAKYG